MFNKGDKVKIVSCKFSSVWYNNAGVGKVFTVEYIRENQHGKYYIGKGFEDGVYESDLELVKEEKEEMQFDMKKEPWFINVNSIAESKAVQQWLFDQGLTWCSGRKKIDDFKIGCLTNFILHNEIEVEGNGFMYSSKNHIHTGNGEREIKFTFKTVIDSVTFPEVKTEQQKQIEELEKTILLAQQQIETLKKGK